MAADAPRPSVLSALPGGRDTIAAIATAAGRGALAVLRVSGPDAEAVAARVIEGWPTPPRVATLAALRDPATGAPLDRALVTRFPEGRSFTGEPMVELSTHGGLVTPAVVLGALLAAGARQAEPGEFTRRAVANGKLSLTQGEAIGDVIDATSRAAQRAALQALDGGLARRVLALRDALLEVEALIAYDIDFPEEDDGPVAPERVAAAVAASRSAIDALLATAPAGEAVRSGAVVVLAGPPNAGKSSLFNALLGRARALVTPLPGTTRDAIEAVIDGREWPLRLVDTAGLRDTADALERLGIEVSESWLARAQVVVACGERVADLAEARRRIAAVSPAPVVAVLTKRDGAGEGDTDAAAAGAVAASAETGRGLGELLARVEAAIAGTLGSPALDAPVVTRARHLAALRLARDELAAFAAARAGDALPAPVAAVHLRAAVAALEELIGVVDTEDVLDRVFRSFCVGK
jgi:tRNA modification GTPase